MRTWRIVVNLFRLLIFVGILTFFPFNQCFSNQESNIDQKEMYKEIQNLKQEIKTLKKEADIRKTLSVTKEEQEEEKEKVLNVAGREYTLMEMHTFGLEYSLRYSYNSVDKLIQLEDGYGADYRQDHILENSLFFEYALLNNLTFNSNIPFIYKYQNLDTEDEQDLTELGDLSFGFQWQPFKLGGSLPAAIINTSISTPTGSSPYDITLGEELYSGSGGYSANLGISFSKAVDPVYLYSTISGVYYLPMDDLSQKWGSKDNFTILKKVSPGSGFSISTGFAYSMSYKISLSLGYQLSYRAGAEYEFESGSKTKTESYVASSLSIGTSWRVSRKRSLHFKVNMGLTDNDSDFSISFRLPMQFSF